MKMSGRKGLLGAALLLFALLVVAGAWQVTYPSDDPKNIRYQLWKAGLPIVDLDRATGTMIGDAHRDELVVGKTRAQLEEKFGYVLTRDQVAPYLRGCIQTSPWKDRNVLFIRSSPWMVVFDGDKATDLVLVKGC